MTLVTDNIDCFEISTWNIYHFCCYSSGWVPGYFSASIDIRFITSYKGQKMSKAFCSRKVSRARDNSRQSYVYEVNYIRDMIPDNQPPNQTTMPTTSTIYLHANQPTLQPRFNPEPSSGQQSEVRVVHQHVAYTLGPNSMKMTCSSCQADIKSTTISDHQRSAHICCIVLCLLGWEATLSHCYVYLRCVIKNIDYFLLDYHVKIHIYFLLSKECQFLYAISSYTEWFIIISTVNSFK